MKLYFISNYFNHHQQFLCDSFNKLCEFNFIKTSQMSKEREQLKYLEVQKKYVIDKIPSMNPDVIIIGSSKKQIDCITKKTLIFKYSERPLKNGVQPIKYIPRFIKWNYQYRRKKVYLLCASAYTSLDYSKFGLFKNKSYKWGYFPETRKYNIKELLSKKKKNSILWVGRFLKWKHPDDAIEIAKRLKENNYRFEMNFIGAGIMEKEMEKLIEKYELNDYVYILDPMTTDKVREYMEESSIYIFTSDKQEGWGAVLNESMNSGCAVVVSHLVGSAPYLVKHNENALIYKYGDIDMLYKSVKYLLDNPNIQKEIGKNAYETITGTWNAEVASERFLNLVNHISNGETYPNLYEDGPCSIAPILKEDWFNEE